MTTDPAAGPATGQAAQLRSDMNTIRNVVEEGRQENNAHRMIIAGSNILFGLLLLIAVPFIVLGTAIPAFVVEEGPGAYVPPLAGAVVVAVLVVLAAPHLLAGWGLFKRRSWGGIAAVVAAVLNFWNVPLGTALAIYTIWAVAKGQLRGDQE